MPVSAVVGTPISVTTMGLPAVGSPAIAAFQWNRAGVPISGASGSSYTPVTADIGSVLTVSVAWFNGVGVILVETSLPTSAVVAAGGLKISEEINTSSIPLGA